MASKYKFSYKCVRLRLRRRRRSNLRFVSLALTFGHSLCPLCYKSTCKAKLIAMPFGQGKRTCMALVAWRSNRKFVRPLPVPPFGGQEGLQVQSEADSLWQTQVDLMPLLTSALSVQEDLYARARAWQSASLCITSNNQSGLLQSFAL